MGYISHVEPDGLELAFDVKYHVGGEDYFTFDLRLIPSQIDELIKGLKTYLRKID